MAKDPLASMMAQAVMPGPVMAPTGRRVAPAGLLTGSAGQKIPLPKGVPRKAPIPPTVKPGVGASKPFGGKAAPPFQKKLT